jgi:hypothetical protein
MTVTTRRPLSCQSYPDDANAGWRQLARLARPLACACALGLTVAAADGSDRSILDTGAVPDGKTLCTAAINRAVGEVAAAGGGTVLVPPGTYLTGTIRLKSRVTLQLENGATLLGSKDIADYPENPAPRPGPELEYGRYALICAQGAEDVAIVGQGRICGQGDHPNFTKKDLVARGVSPRDAYLKRPYGLSFVGCRRVTVEGVTLQNIAFWCEDYLDCDGVVVHGVTVDSMKNDYNNDGIDIDGSRNVRVSDCRFYAGDDAICLKAGYRDCENVTVTNCSVTSLANGVKFGTASNAGFKNIAISNIVCDQIQAAGIALEIVDGGTMDGVALSNFVMRDVGTAVFIRLGNRAKQWTDIPPPGIGQIRNISISHVVANVHGPDGRPLASSITGLAGHPVENVTISDVRIVAQRAHAKAECDIPLAGVGEHERDYPESAMFGPLPAYGFFVRHVQGLTLRNLDVSFAEEDFRSALVCDDVTDLRLEGLRTRTLPESHPVIQLQGVRGALLSGLVAPAGTKVFLDVGGNSERIVVQSSNLGAASQPVAPADGEGQSWRLLP